MRKFHEVVGLANLLITERAMQGVPLDAVFTGELVRHTRVVASHWDVTMRYAQTAADNSDVMEAFESVDWVLSSYEQLWR